MVCAHLLGIPAIAVAAVTVAACSLWRAADLSVSCPANANLDDGSRLKCKAGVTETGTTTQPGIGTHNAVVDVEIDGDNARWELRVTS
jgi:hypothetical protein